MPTDIARLDMLYFYARTLLNKQFAGLPTEAWLALDSVLGDGTVTTGSPADGKDKDKEGKEKQAGPLLGAQYQRLFAAYCDVHASNFEEHFGASRRNARCFPVVPPFYSDAE